MSRTDIFLVNTSTYQLKNWEQLSEEDRAKITKTQVSIVEHDEVYDELVNQYVEYETLVRAKSRGEAITRCIEIMTTSFATQEKLASRTADWYKNAIVTTHTEEEYIDYIKFLFFNTVLNEEPELVIEFFGIEHNLRDSFFAIFKHLKIGQITKRPRSFPSVLFVNIVSEIQLKQPGERNQLFFQDLLEADYNNRIRRHKKEK